MIKEILENLGYVLIDRGTYWHTSAVFRGGDNNTAIQVYKDTGVWKDFVEDSCFMPFEALVKKTLNTEDELVIKDVLKGKSQGVNIKLREKKLLKEETIYPESSLIRLLPHYDFYLNRGISRETLKAFKVGLATSGKMYRRLVFPIYTKDGKIHGFSGRKVGDNNPLNPKWLHTGKTMDWFYPYYLTPEVSSAIIGSRSVYIVESIGDSMALFNNNIKNNLVSFGLNMSPKFIAKLGALDVDKIFVAFNNDFENKRNRGFEAGVKAVLKMSETIDFKKIYFAPPEKNDFGVMLPEGFSIYSDRTKNLTHQESMKQVLEIGKEMIADKLVKKTFEDNFKKFVRLYNFNYE
jgi:hypothetical protein